MATGDGSTAVRFNVGEQVCFDLQEGIGLPLPVSEGETVQGPVPIVSQCGTVVETDRRDGDLAIQMARQSSPQNISPGRLWRESEAPHIDSRQFGVTPFDPEPLRREIERVREGLDEHNPDVTRQWSGAYGRAREACEQELLNQFLPDRLVYGRCATVAEKAEEKAKEKALKPTRQRLTQLESELERRDPEQVMRRLIGQVRRRDGSLANALELAHDARIVVVKDGTDKELQFLDTSTKILYTKHVKDADSVPGAVRAVLQQIVEDRKTEFRAAAARGEKRCRRDTRILAGRLGVAVSLRVPVESGRGVFTLGKPLGRPGSLWVPATIKGARGRTVEVKFGASDDAGTLVVVWSDAPYTIKGGREMGFRDREVKEKEPHPVLGSGYIEAIDVKPLGYFCDNENLHIFIKPSTNNQRFYFSTAIRPEL